MSQSGIEYRYEEVPEDSGSLLTTDPRECKCGDDKTGRIGAIGWAFMN